MIGLVSMYFMGVEGSLVTPVQSFYINTSIYPMCLVTFYYYLNRYVIYCLSQYTVNTLANLYGFSGMTRQLMIRYRVYI